MNSETNITPDPYQTSRAGSLRELIERDRQQVRKEVTSGSVEDTTFPFSRRGFLATVSAGSLVLMGRFASGSSISIARADDVDPDSFAPNLFVSIDPDGTVHAVCHRSEMGTGIRTGLPRIIADELEADWSRVKVVQAKGDKRLGDQNTDGSNSIVYFFDTMRRVGGTARLMLERAAAKKWGVPAGECYAENHQVKHRGSSKAAGFGDLVEIARTLEVPDPGEIKFKPREEWDLIGKPLPITDLDDIITGKAIFGIDARLENQLFAVVARPPVVGATLKSVDKSAAEKMPGVVAIVEIPKFKGAPVFQPLGGVAVCATSTWAAWQARDALKIEWEEGENATYDSDAFAAQLKETVQKPGKPVRTSGNAAAELAGGKKVIQADYSIPHLAHAPMEPPCAVADVKTEGDKIVSCYVLSATQNPQAVQQAVSKALGIAEEEVLAHVTLLGSAFGRKSKPDYCVEAAILSRELQRPVHVTFTREDDLRHDYYHAISAIHCEAAVDDQGKPTAWLQRVAYPTISSLFNEGDEVPEAWEAEMGLTDLPFDIPNLQLEVGKAKSHVRTGWLRSVCHIQQNFAASSFADELARAAGRDPLEYLLELLGPDRKLDLEKIGLKNRGADPEEYPFDIARLKNVLRRAARNADWKRREDLPKGHGLGIACARSFLGYTGHVVEVKVSQEGDVTIENVWCSLDAGTIVSPDRVVAQIEGAAVMASGQVRYGEVKFKNGRAIPSNYDGYRVPKMYDSPKNIHVDVVSSTAAPGGVGETGVPSFGPAFCNAIFDATGIRVRDLPLSRHDLSWS